MRNDRPSRWNRHFVGDMDVVDLLIRLGPSFCFIQSTNSTTPQCSLSSTSDFSCVSNSKLKVQGFNSLLRLIDP